MSTTEALKLLIINRFLDHHPEPVKGCQLLTGAAHESITGHTKTLRGTNGGLRLRYATTELTRVQIQ